MKKTVWFGWLLGMVMAGPLTTRAGSFTANGPEFQLDGQPFLIRSGELHYARIPREYWAHRLRMARAMGLNTVSTYIFWNFHEPRAGQFNFQGNADVAEFCRLAGAEGLKVILRPGPYCCGEWDMGGLPWWLLKSPTVRLRTRNATYLAASRDYFGELGRQLAPLQITRGGPIILVQVENEYVSYGVDTQYLAALAEALKAAGFEVPLYLCEVEGQQAPNIAGLFNALNGSSDPETWMTRYRAQRPNGPWFCGELYTGWFDIWGADGQAGAGNFRSASMVEWMLKNRISFNLYMAHGGTTFGLQAGANGPPYQATMTSYDYGAPISEAGWDTPLFHRLRQMISQQLPADETLPSIPERPLVINIPRFEMTEWASLVDNLPKAAGAARPLAMENLDQGGGCVLYRAKLPPGGGEQLRIRDLRDNGWIFVDGQRVGILERGWGPKTVRLPARKRESVLDILVEAMGRINYGEQMHDRKGITEKVELAEGSSVRELLGWEMFSLPLDEPQRKGLKFKMGGTDKPAFHRGWFNLRALGDTFLDLSAWGKGVVWINGHNLGRFWQIGPQQTLYCPAPWLRTGRNELVILDLQGVTNRWVAGTNQPMLSQGQLRSYARQHRKAGQELRLADLQPFQSGAFAPPGSQKQIVRFAPAKGRYVCLEALSSQTGDGYATCAELGLLSLDGSEISRTNWKIVYASSEELRAEDGSAANVLDGEPATFWHSQWRRTKAQPPHQLVLDLGREEYFSGFWYLPRADQPNGRIKDYKIYVSVEPFLGIQ